MPPTITIKRTTGLGDVLMLIPVAAAVKRKTGAEVHLVTSASIASILREGDGCGFDHIQTPADWTPPPSPAPSFHDLDVARYSLVRQHQVDAFLADFGIEATAEDREIRLPSHPRAGAMVDDYLEEIGSEPGKGRILLHAATGVPNRSWPAGHWQALADTLTAEGHEVFVIGNNTASAGKGCTALSVAPYHNLTDRFSFWQTLELMRRSDVLVSTDSAPIHMAGATGIGIVGIFSVAAGAWRLPFRPPSAKARTGAAAWAQPVEPACALSPCYPAMLDPRWRERAAAFIRERGNGILFEWCCRDDLYGCLRAEIQPQQVTEAIGSGLSQR